MPRSHPTCARRSRGLFCCRLGSQLLTLCILRGIRVGHFCRDALCMFFDNKITYGTHAIADDVAANRRHQELGYNSYQIRLSA